MLINLILINLRGIVKFELLLQQIARPSGNMDQNSVYKEHKRMHCLSYQTITTPDGIVFHMYGPVEGRLPDAFLYRESCLDKVSGYNLFVNGIQYCIYDDQSYVLRPWMQTTHHSLIATEGQLAFNTSINAAPTAVDLTYKDLKQDFASQ